LQVWHALPLFPHVGKLAPSVHELPLQQPPVHEFASQVQAPPTHSCPAVHWVPPPQVQVLPLQPSPVDPHPKQACAPVPHCAAEGASHVLPLQQPFGQEVASHVHAPATHSWPGDAHAAHATPPVPQVWFPDVWQTPLLSQQPFGHVVALHETQLPPEHV
jgi:hypothetical protein